VSADFELGDVPRGILVGRPLDVSELGFVGRKVAMNVEWEFDCGQVSLANKTEILVRTFEELVFLLPIDIGGKVEIGPRVGFQRRCHKKSIQ
jgi:hypothetical protein